MVMPNQNDNILGEVNVGQNTRLVFSLSNRAGQQFAHVRKFVATARYKGPTKSGFTLAGNQLNEVVGLLRGLAGSVPTAGQTQVGVVTRSGGSEFHVQVVLADDGAPLPSVDIREHVNTAGYVGFTKKGVRFPWDKLPEVLRHFEAQLGALGAAIKNDATLFPEIQPEWVQGSTDRHRQTATELDELLGKLPDFPKEFLPDNSTIGPALKLPSDSLELKMDREGRWLVSTLSGFHHETRNQVEGKFILYAQQRGNSAVAQPTAMIHIFKAVTAYEKYCRDQFNRIVKALELKSRNRQLAEFQTRQLFKRYNLPLD
jgi:hypothetical protein